MEDASFGLLGDDDLAPVERDRARDRGDRLDRAAQLGLTPRKASTTGASLSDAHATYG